MIRKIWKRSLIERFKERVIKFHELFPTAPLGDKYFEYQLFLACIDTNTKVSNYEFNSHTPGTDMQIEGKNISLKGGKVMKTHYEFSGSRTTSFRTIKEKIKYLSTSGEDYIISLTSNNNKKKKQIDYCFLLVDYKRLDFNKLYWIEEESERGKSYRGIGDFDVHIKNALSDQAWFRLPLSYIDKKEIFSVKY